VSVAQEVPFELFHRGVPVGTYRADLVAETVVLIETKTGHVLDPTTPSQLRNCLCAAKLTLGLMVYFGPAGVQVKRMIKSDSDVTYE
jgi:GxxExxY protein